MTSYKCFKLGTSTAWSFLTSPGCKAGIFETTTGPTAHDLNASNSLQIVTGVEIIIGNCFSEAGKYCPR